MRPRELGIANRRIEVSTISSAAVSEHCLESNGSIVVPTIRTRLRAKVIGEGSGAHGRSLNSVDIARECSCPASC